MSVPRLAIADLGRVFQGESVSGLSEWQLLERYLERRDELAFEALVTRHGPMVWGVCRRMLGPSPEAEDAFQATFLVLVRRARDLGPRDAIGPWLFGVATRVASRARTQVARDRRFRAATPDLPAADRHGSAIDPDLVEVLDQELSRLPGKYRSPLVLCYLQGRTHEEAARDLQWPLGTVKGRLSRAREVLRSRLARRGFAPSAGVVGFLSSPDLRIVLERPLAARTVGASARLAAGQSLAHVVSQSITSLVEGVMTNMFLTKLKWAAVALVATGFAFTSAAVLGRQAGRPKDDQGQAKANLAPPRPDRSQNAPAGPGMDQQGGRAGSARRIYAELLVDAPDGRASDPRSRQILEKLDQPISMSFQAETPLDDVLKYIKQATTTATFSGVPIYLEPAGLQDAERSINSTVQIDLEGVPLRRTLQLMLAQLDLVYFVQDGFVVITSEERARKALPPPMAGPTPLDRMVEKSERGDLDSSELKELVEVLKLRRQVRSLHESETPGENGKEASSAAGHPTPSADQTAELLKEVRELIQLLKAEKQGKKPGSSQ